ncbi:MAG TPA: zinc dependent phospholipase C family protein [Tissierellales bacterium]|nr:zinc dependent phospholipase C family protein [Tissierellales bacterium]
MESFEVIYNKFLTNFFKIINPIKKSIIRTQCEVHKSINIDALNILKNDEYLSEYSFFSEYIEDINKGAVWADQNLKSSNHFYNPNKKRGLFGRKNALDLGSSYYSLAHILWEEEKHNKSLFYLGAALHIIQDMTIPQHANIRLLDNHRQYELYIKEIYKYTNDFKVEKGTYLLKSIKSYIRFNARVTIKIHNKFKDIPNNKDRFYRIAKCGLPLAKRTTAGAMVLFYNEIFPNS